MLYYRYILMYDEQTCTRGRGVDSTHVVLHYTYYHAFPVCIWLVTCTVCTRLSKFHTTQEFYYTAGHRTLSAQWMAIRYFAKTLRAR